MPQTLAQQVIEVTVLTPLELNAFDAKLANNVTVHSDKSAFLCHCEAFRPKQS